ncbi:hypothetical protein K9B33_12395 [Sphingobium sp. 3R8]|uniref:hypothetical protein n=1 Tax=Sphingobium sp. 3R8 TaxID=2874921 RepID=UPI001CC91408|nr:hypothetical protein [Sphingobium sp. 3R8]MBZ9648351.1 hypothetical protein [Sphingobium sp. 3R8]
MKKRAIRSMSLFAAIISPLSPAVAQDKAPIAAALTASIMLHADPPGAAIDRPIFSPGRRVSGSGRYPNPQYARRHRKTF